jgi:surface antigen
VKRRFLLWGLFGLLVVLGCLHATKGHAQAAYPYPNKPCVHAPYGVQGTAPNWCPNYDWGDRPNDTSQANVISPYGYYYRNCTDYAAWKVSSLGVPADRYKGLGDAKTWAIRAPAKGVRVDGAAAVGSVAVRTSGQFGHLAFVEEVRADGIIRVSHYNYRADGNYSESVGTPASFGFAAFVHFEDFMPPPAMPPPAPALPAEPPPPPDVPVPEPVVSAEPLLSPPVEALVAPEPAPEETTNEMPEPEAQPVTAQVVAAEDPEPTRETDTETVMVLARASKPADDPQPVFQQAAPIVRTQPPLEGRGLGGQPAPSLPARAATILPDSARVAPPTHKTTGTLRWSRSEVVALLGLAGCLIAFRCFQLVSMNRRSPQAWFMGLIHSWKR